MSPYCMHLCVETFSAVWTILLLRNMIGGRAKCAAAHPSLWHNFRVHNACHRVSALVFGDDMFHEYSRRYEGTQASQKRFSSWSLPLNKAGRWVMECGYRRNVAAEVYASASAASSGP